MSFFELFYDGIESKKGFLVLQIGFDLDEERCRDIYWNDVVLKGRKD